MSEVLFYVIEERYDDDVWTVGFCSKIPETDEEYEKINNVLHLSKEHIDELFLEGYYKQTSIHSYSIDKIYKEEFIL